MSTPRIIFLSLPVSDVAKSTAFYKALGFSLNPQFTGDTAACLAISDVINVMLATHEKFRELTPKAICETRTSVQVLMTLSCSSREEVDDLVAKALTAGGSCSPQPDDYGFMYQHDFTDLDGHGWGLSYMSAMPPQ